MATEIIMPQMGFDMKEGTLVRWIKQEGDRVTKGEPLAEIETDKAVVEIEAFASGVLRTVAVVAGTTVPVGQVIGVIGEPGESIPDVPVAAPSAMPESPQSPPPAKAPAAATEASGATAPRGAAPARGERVRASPLARKEAESRGVDLTHITGTGPGGRISRDDVIAFAPPPTPPMAQPAGHAAAPARPATAVTTQREAPEGDVLVPPSRMRQAIATAMARSMREVPHFYVTIEIDMTEAMRLRAQLNKALEGQVRISVNDMIIKASAKALQKHPHFNASFSEQGIQVHRQINVSVAVALDEGIVAPSIADAASKSLPEIAQTSAELIGRARTSVLTATEYSGGTFSISNMGMYNIEDFTAIITPPQAAVLAVGSVRKMPVVRDDQIKVIESMKVTLSTDHRVADGAQAARFLADVRALLENPVLLLV